MKLADFNRIYNDNYFKALRFTQSYVQDEFAAEDIVSEAFISIWEHENAETIISIEAYLINTLRNKCLNYLRHVKIQTDVHEKLSESSRIELEYRIADLENCIPQDILSEELRIQIRKLLNNLPPKTREVFIANRMKGLSYNQIAEQQAISTKAVEYHISKALRLLRKNLKDYIYLALLVPFVK